MTAVISLLRAVNVGGRNMIKMEQLRLLCESLGLRDVQTYVQSGNIVFKTSSKDHALIAKKIASGIEKLAGFRPAVITRTAAEMREVIARNPFANRPGIEPGKLLVTFLDGDPDAESRDKVKQMTFDPEELHIGARELYIYFPNGSGRSKLPVARIDKILNTSGTARNWNTVVKLLEMAEKLEAGC